jgi:hypothetical protein
MPKNRKPRVRNDSSSKKRAITKKKTEKIKPGVGQYKGIAHDSLNELYCLQWLFELKDKGYIEDIKRAESFLLTEGFYNYYTEPIKRGTSSRTKDQVILRPSSYTPEFKVIWTDKYKEFVWTIGSNTKFDKCFVGHVAENHKVYTLIECKSSGYDFSNMTRLFINNQKFVFDKYKLFVNLVKPDKLFERTFCPKSYQKTATGKARKIKFEVKTIDEYLNGR